MKHSIFKAFMLIAFIAITATGNAQLNYGVRAGLNYSALSKPYDLNNGNHFNPGALAGLTLGYSLNETFAINAEALYQVKGSKELKLYGNAIEDVEYNLSYLNIPLLFEARFGEKYGMPETWSINTYVGPYYARLIEASNIYEDESVFDLNDIVRESDAGIVIGVGVSKDIGAIEFFTDLRYEAGFMDILDDHEDLRNRTFSINVGVHF